MMRLAVLSLLLALASPALAGPIRCTTYEVKSLNRLQTLCDDGTRVVHAWNKTLPAGRVPSPRRRGKPVPGR
jgi:hypothetical protein